MSKVDEAIREFVKDRVGGVIVNDAEGNVLYQDPRLIFSEKGMRSWKRKRPPVDDRKTWEFTDFESMKYYRAETGSVKIGAEIYQCHLLTDISDYASLFQDISDYSKRISDMSDFQKNILAKISQAYDSFLPELAEFCNVADAELYVKTEGMDFAYKSSYGKRLTRHRIPLSDEVQKLFHMKRFDFLDGYYCFLAEHAPGQSYALFLRRGAMFNEEYFRDASVYNVVRLYIENGLLREHIVYESEHDGLTGLFNKAKYLSMRESDFCNPESLAIFYFDVNNLKQVNDTLGHEAGDQLILRASQSIMQITGENVHGFRMGGDEFLVVGLDLSEKEANLLRQQWESALEDINRSITEDRITIACGLAYAQKPYDYDALMALADERMYQNKREIKERYGLPER